FPVVTGVSTAGEPLNRCARPRGARRASRLDPRQAHAALWVGESDSGEQVARGRSSARTDTANSPPRRRRTTVSGLRPELLVEVTVARVSAGRIRHGTKDLALARGQAAAGLPAGANADLDGDLQAASTSIVRTVYPNH